MKKEVLINSSFWDQAFSRRISRRGLLQGAVVGSAGLIATTLIGCDEFEPNSNNVEKNIKSEDVVRKIKAFEKELGDRYLNFEEAKYFVPLVAQLFSENTGSWQKPEDIANNTFLIWQNPPYIKDIDLPSTDITGVFESDWFWNIKDNYPNLVLTEEMTRRILTAFWYTSIIGFVENDGRIFIFNYKAREELHKFFTGGYPPHQYQEIAPKVDCTPRTPVVELKSLLLHEMAHRDTVPTPLPVEAEILKSFKGRLKKSKKHIISGEKQGLKVDLLTEKGEKIPFRGFEEYFADFIQAKISVNNGLSYSIGARPLEIFNFERILEQAGISYYEILSLHREANIKEFLLRIGRAAKNKDVDSERNALDFGAWVATKIGAWEDIKPYFPEVDTTSYVYYKAPKPGEESGCLR